MKKAALIILTIVLSCACKKGEVPSNQSQYVGTWSNKSYDSQYILTINDNGTAEYSETRPGITKTVSGGIYFDTYDFKIGTFRINKKFKADQASKKNYRIS